MGRNRRLRRATLVGSLVVMLIGGVVAAPSAQAGPLETKLLRIINRVRTNHDLDTIRVNKRLGDDAGRHTRKMIRRGELFDPRNLYEMLEPYKWNEVGAAVVGCDDTLNELVRQWMGHGVHRSILLLSGLERAGLGVTQVEGGSACGRNKLWATVILYG